MNANKTKLMRALRGEPTVGAPFWEVWFGMGRLAERVLGRPISDPRDRVELAQLMGWECLTTWVPGHVIGAKQGEASDGTKHYVPGGKVPLEELYARPERDLSEAAENARKVIEVARNEGLATIVYVPWCFHAASTGLGLEHLSYLIYDEPEYVDAVFEWVEEGTRRAIREVIVPLGIDVVLFDGDCAYKNGLMVNPAIFRKLVFERTAKTIAPLKEAGILYTLHSDGKADELLPLLVELGFSGFHGVEAQANDLGDIKQRFGRDITLIGNMDVVFLTYATVEEVRAETERMLTIGMEGGRYIAACNTSPLDYIPYENYMAMVDVIKSY
ncbi:MAG: uroporphyrinogen decarboxylase family protein [Armatimonadota bacterium]|nr:uroporphyrinogen decarboxylase family protein [Armatimonadota bacterium]